jgi:DNA-binding SARP family transcriptional activator/tetratricopeptide (TPR) repeat protein
MLARPSRSRVVDVSGHGGEGAELDVHLLGPIEVLRGGEPIDLPGGRALSLMALLALRVGQGTPADRLIDELWGGEAPATARTLLQGFISKLRKALGAAVIETTGTGYRLALADDAVDAHRFRAMVQQSQGLDGRSRESRLAGALALWRGPALADLTYEPFAQRAITEFEDQRLTAREDLIQARLDLGGHRQVVGELEELVAGHPFREGLWALLVLALYRSGRQAEALEACRRARTTLVSELGLEPGPELRSLEQRVLNQDPLLDAATAPSGPRTTERAWMPRERRTVTAVFVEVSPTDPDADPELEEITIATALERVEEAMTSHGGTAERSPAGRVVGWFGLSAAHEDDPLRALRAAIRARELTATVGVHIRVGVETGDTVTDGTSATGSAIATADRLLQSADEGEILIGPAVTRLVHGAAVVARAEGDRAGAQRLLQVHANATLLPRDLRAPMVGRQRALTRLRTTFSGTVRRGTPTRVTIVGEAGIGKSRLARAFHDSIADAAAMGSVRCSAATGGSLVTLQELLSPVVGDRAAGLASEPPQELFAAVRASLERAAQLQPVVLTVDDCHWAETTVLDLLEYLTVSLDGPVMLLCLARPELLDSRPEWGANRAHTAVLPLQPLGAGSIAQIVTDRTELALPAQRVDRITKLAQGNPLFAEQFVATLEHDDLDRVPASLDGLLTSRIDRLGPAEKDLLRCASVAGSALTQQALDALVPDEARPFVQRHLAALQRRRMLHRSGDAISFGHDLIRDAAYRSVTRADRASLHQRLAEWLGSHDQDRAPHLDAVIGHHLEQAVLNRRQLGLDDESTDALAARAGDRLTTAGSAAFGRMDLPAAHDLLIRGLALLPADHPARTRSTQLLAETSLPMGHHAQAQQLLAELAERPDVDQAARWSARLERTRSLTLTDPGPGGLDDAADVARQALESFDREDDDTGRAQALFLQGWLELLRGRPADSEAAARRAIEHADRAGAHREEVAARWLTLQALIEGPAPVEHCLDEATQLARFRGSEHPIAMLGRARLLAMATSFREAEGVVQAARRLIIERLRIRRLVMFADWSKADVHALAGQVPFAMRSYRAALDRVKVDGEQGHTAELAARLALLLAAQDRRGEARELASQSRAAAPAGYVAVQALSRAAGAWTMVREQPTQALALAREAMELAPDQMPNLKAETTLNMARVEHACALREDARSHRALAEHLYRQKGNLAAATLAESTSLS